MHVTKSGAGTLRHGRTHRAITRASRRPQAVFAQRDLDWHDIATSEVPARVASERAKLRRWAESCGIEIMTVRGRILRDVFEDMLRIGLVAEMRGPLTIPCTVAGWRLTPATNSQVQALGLRRTERGLEAAL